MSELILALGGELNIWLGKGIIEPVISGLAFGLILGFIGGLSDGKLPGFSAAISGGLISGLIGGQVVEQRIGLISGLIGGINIVLVGEIIVGLGIGASVAMGVTLISSIVNGLSTNDDSQISTIEELHWNPPSIQMLLLATKNGAVSGWNIGQVIGSVSGILSGIIIFLSFLLGIGLNPVLSAETNALMYDNSLSTGFSVGLNMGVLFAFYGVIISYAIVSLIVGISGAVTNGFDACFAKKETRQKTEPNQGMRSSFRNLWRMSLFYVLLLGGIGLLLSLPSFWFLIPLFELATLITFLFIAYGIWHGFTKYGGDTVIRHYVLRVILQRYKILPFPLNDKKLIAFLDSMVELILLRRTGNGYIFLHRSLLEHFAAKHPAHQFLTILDSQPK